MTNHSVMDPPPGACWCRRCEDARLEGKSIVEQILLRRFIVCPDCGNKRCPKATQHDLPCGNSNDSGQPGSDYT